MSKWILPFACLGFMLLHPANAADETVKKSEPEYRKALDFLFFECLLKRRPADAPGTAAGGVQSSFERTSTGWSLFLLNDSDGPAEAEVELDLEKVKMLTSVRDMVDGERFAAPYAFGAPYRFKVPVESGKYRILRITAEPFEMDYEKHY